MRGDAGVAAADDRVLAADAADARCSRCRAVRLLQGMLVS